MSAVWWARLRPAADSDGLPRVDGGDDADDARWLPVAEVLADDALAFDHGRILGDVLADDAAQRPAAGIAVRFDLPDEEGLRAFDSLVEQVLPGIEAQEPGTLTYAVHAIEGAPLARLFFETYAAEGHPAHEARPATAAFLARIRDLVADVRVEHLHQRAAVRR